MYVVEALERAGHIVVNWEGELRTKDILEVGEALTCTAGGEDSKSRSHLHHSTRPLH
jgi:hypothetical protein